MKRTALLFLLVLALCGELRAQGIVDATTVPTAGLQASRVLKDSRGRLVSFDGYNSGSAQFIQIHDAVTVPADGAVPLKSWPVPAASYFSFVFPVPLTCSSGIVVCNSSTVATKTIGTANVTFSAQIQ